MNYRWLFYEFSCWLQQLVCVGHTYLYGIYCSVGFRSSDFLIAFCFSNQSCACLAKECKENTTSLRETYSSMWNIRFEMMWFTRRKNDINRGSLFSFFFFSFRVCVCITHSSARRLRICWGPALLNERLVSLCYRKTTAVNVMILSHICLMQLSSPVRIRRQSVYSELLDATVGTCGCRLLLSTSACSVLNCQVVSWDSCPLVRGCLSLLPVCRSVL